MQILWLEVRCWKQHRLIIISWVVVCHLEIVDPAVIHLFLSPLGQLTQNPSLQYPGIICMHVHEGHPLSSFSYPRSHLLEQAASAQGLQLQVSQPCSSTWNPFGHLDKQKIAGHHCLGLELHTPQPRTTCKATIVQFTNQCIHICLHIFLALFSIRTQWKLIPRRINMIAEQSTKDIDSQLSPDDAQPK